MIIIILRLSSEKELWTDAGEDVTHVVRNVADDWKKLVSEKYPAADVTVEIISDSSSYGQMTHAYVDGDMDQEIVRDVLSIKEGISFNDPAMWQPRDDRDRTEEQRAEMFANELEALVSRYAFESDIKLSSIVGLLQCQINYLMIDRWHSE